MSKGVFIIGTGTGVGKTFVTALLVKKIKKMGYHAAYYKAAMSGNIRDNSGSLIPGDACFVKKIAGLEQSTTEMCPYIYENAVSPHLASILEGHRIELEVIKQGYEKVCENQDYISVEGSGGILCPLCFGEQELWMEDVIKACGLSSLIVADAGLGTINSVLLTVEYMRQKDLEVKGIIFNHFHPDSLMEKDNIKLVEVKSGLKVLACVKDNDEDIEMDEELLISIYE
jgi:dethiobiotin synthetase